MVIALRKVPEEVEKEILKRLLAGDTYRKIAKDFNVSLATVYRIAEDARRRAPDFDELRKLSITFKKADSNVFDAIRGSSLLDELNQLGASLNELEDWIRLFEKLSSEELEPPDFVECALRLSRLEQETGIAYEEVAKDFEEKLNQVAELEARKYDLEIEVSRLEDQLTKAEEDVAKHERLKKLGLDKLDTLAKFIDDYEALEFNIREVQTLAACKRSLNKMNIKPDKLEKYLTAKGPLDAQISNLKREAKTLKAQVDGLERRNKGLIEKNSALMSLSKILADRKIYIPCKNCGVGLPIPLDTQENHQHMLENRRFYSLRCPRCGFPNQFTPQDVLVHIGWILLPKDENISE